MRSAVTFGLVVMLAGGFAWAGELTPPGAPAPTMHSLEDIYNLLNAGPPQGGCSADGILVFPHFFESSGNINSTPNSFDTAISFVYTSAYRAGLMRKEDQVAPKLADLNLEIYVYTPNGNLMQSVTGTPVAAPWVITLNALDPENTVRIGDMIEAAGGFPTAVVVGYIVVRISGGDWNEVAVQGYNYNAVTGPFDLNITPLNPIRVPLGVKVTSGGAPAGKK